MPGKTKKEQGDMSPRRPLQVAWPNDPAWKTFGDRLDFLSPERQHLASQGRLRVMPALNPERRQPYKQG